MSLSDRYLDWKNLCVSKILFIVVYSQKISCLWRNLSFLCSVISQGKVVALNKWGGKWKHLSMTHRLTTNCAKNYCNRTLIVKVIVENVVTCFFIGTQCISKLSLLNGRTPTDYYVLICFAKVLQKSFAAADFTQIVARVNYTRYAKKPGPLCFTAYNFRNIE